MQISRHWRLNAQRYRLEGFRTERGELSLQDRPETLEDNDENRAEAAQVAEALAVDAAATKAATAA